METIKKILIATGNSNKVKEIREKMAGIPIELIGLADTGVMAEIEETGSTFQENAALKAVGYAQLTGIPALADDSGLEATALGGRPGVLSARYGGEGTSHAEKMRLLLNELGESPLNEDRSARFVCSLALASPSGGIIFETDGICRGILAEEPRGEGGFGYDPIFIPEGHSLTFGELSGAVKQEISHRARAIEDFIRFLRNNSSG